MSYDHWKTQNPQDNELGSAPQRGANSNTAQQEENPFAARAALAQETQTKKPTILSQITTRKRRRPVFGVLYGPPGVGKSTFATESPDPIFIPTERGLDQIGKVARFPTPRNLVEFGSYLKAIEEEPNDYKTVVIDTGDALELLINDAVCDEGKVKSLEEFGGGYGKGAARAKEYWARLLMRLTRMSEARNILLICHSHLRTVNDPMLAAAYDIYEMKIQPKSAELIRQSVDLILFARLATTVMKDTPRSKKGRGIVSGDREMFTQPASGLESKNRYNLESPMEFSWAALQDGIDKFYNQ
jgi:hypothetical protein